MKALGWGIVAAIGAATLTLIMHGGTPDAPSPAVQARIEKEQHQRGAAVSAAAAGIETWQAWHASRREKAARKAENND